MTTSRDGPPDLEKAGFRRTTSSVFTRSSTNSLSKSTGQQRSNGKIRAAWNYVLPCISWMWNGDGKLSQPATVALMLKASVGIGVMSLPKAFDTLGLVPGMLCLFFVWSLTTASGCMIGVIHKKHPDIGSYEDLARHLVGKKFGWFIGFFFRLFWVAIAASAMMGTTIAFNAITHHGLYTKYFNVCSAAIAFSFSIIPSLKPITVLAYVGLFAIFASVIYMSAAVGLQASQAGTRSDWSLWNATTPAEAFTAMSSLVFACSGTTANFGIISEMRDPRKYHIALSIAQIIILVIYNVCGVVVYYYRGSEVTSPPFASAGERPKLIGYGIAFTGLLASMIWLLSISSRDSFRALNHHSSHFDLKNRKQWIKWLFSTFITTVIAIVIAGTVPTFDEALSLLGAVFVPLFCFFLVPVMMLCDGRRRENPDRRWTFTHWLSIAMIIVGVFVCAAGIYGSAMAIDHTKKSGLAKPFANADNSITT